MAKAFALGLPAIPPQSFAFRPDASPRDIDAHLVVRTTLLNLLLLKDRRTHELFRTFGGLLDEALRFAAFNDQFAVECGWRDRRHMFSEPDRHDPTRSPRCDEFLARLRAFPWTRLEQFPVAAADLVFTTWQLPQDHPRERWTWLVEDLRRLMATLLVNEIQDQDYTIALSVPPTPAPHIELTFTTRHGESRTATRDRLQGLLDDADHALGPEPPRGGTILSAKNLRRDVILFWLRQMNATSWKKLAHQYCRKGDQRRTVKHDYERARRLLSEIPA